MKLQLTKRSMLSNPVLIAAGTTVLAHLLIYLNLEALIWGLLLLAFMSLGLSHGAIDYLADQNIKSTKDLLRYIASYIIKGALLGVVWYFLPDFALLGFVVFSAWHFGQTDFNEWQLTQGLGSFLWGLVALLLLLGLHFPETIAVLQHIPGLKFHHSIMEISENQLLFFKIFITAAGLVLYTVYRSTQMLFTLSYLLLTAGLPLLISFGIYFVLQHSLHGWKHLKAQLKLTSAQMFRKAFPYTSFTVVFIAIFLYAYHTHYLGMLFIALSCISMPHVLSMDHFYRRK